MVIDVLPAVIAQKSVIRQMMELYFHDLSEFEAIEMDEYGHFGYKYLDPYWTEDDRHPFLVKAEGKLAGFVLVNQHTLLPGSEYAIAEFFILRKYRRQKIGQTVACRVFNMFSGHWESHQTVENKIAQQFWRKVIINISSIGGKISFPLGSLYHGSKFAVEGLSEALSFELESIGVKMKLNTAGEDAKEIVANRKAADDDTLLAGIKAQFGL